MIRELREYEVFFSATTNDIHYVKAESEKEAIRIARSESQLVDHELTVFSVEEVGDE